MLLKKIFLFFALSVTTAVAYAQEGITETIIISTNDVHGQIDNFSKMAAYVRSLKKNHRDVFVLNAGDLVNGNPVVDQAEDKGYPIIDIMNRIPYDVSCLGNHEFENGEEVLQRRITQSSSVFLCANMNVDPHSALHPLKPWCLLHTHAGITIAVLGLSASSSNPCLVKNVTVSDPVKKALEYRRLRDSADVFIALTHIGYKQDSILARNMKELDLIVGGHSHTELPNGMLVNSVLITQAGDKLRYVGKTVLKMKGHRLISKTFEMIDLNALKEEDPTVRAQIKAYDTNNDFDKVAGYASTAFINKEDMGSLKADAIAEGLNLDIAFDHSRNISYSHFPAGKITVCDLYEWDSYDYKIIRYELTAAEIRQLILNAMKKEKEPVLFVSGIRYVLKVNAAGETKDVVLKDDKGLLDETKLYSVGMNSFIACHYMPPDKQGRELPATAISLLIAHLRTHQNVDYGQVNRITIEETGKSRARKYGFRPDLIRGPYLQTATTNSILIRWRTDEPDISLVRFGILPGRLDHLAADSNLVREHCVRLSGLAPETKYYYLLEGSRDTLQGDENNSFVTLPPAGKQGIYRIGVFGDCGNNSINQRNTRDQFMKYLGKDPLNAWILLGDNAYSFGKDAEYQTNFFNIYKDALLKKYPLFPSPGNHDYHDEPFSADIARSSGNVAYYQNFSMPENGESGGTPSHTAAFYSFDIGNIHFLSLDSHGMEDNDSRLFDTTGRQVRWIKEDLAANRNKGWIIAYWHHPPYTMGSHNADEETQLRKIRENFIRILERNGVDLVLCGHSHSYERSRLMQGYYGPENAFNTEAYCLSQSSGRYDGSPASCPYIKDSSGKGTVYVVSGSAGQLGGQQKGFPHPALPYSDVTHGGACLLEIDSNRLDLKWIGADGLIRDHFTIMKEVNKKVVINAHAGDTITLTASYIGKYRWNGQAADSRSIRISPLSGTSFYIVHDPENCLADTFEIHAAAEITRLSPTSVPPVSRKKKNEPEAQLIRGPYLQVATDTSILIRWRTSALTRSQVRYGVDASHLDNMARDLTLVSEHKVHLSGLLPSTKYYYSIGALQDTLQYGKDNYFYTLPTQGKEGFYRIGVFGDCGTNSVSQRKVRDAFLQYLGQDHLNAWILLGDNAYNDGTDAEFQSNFFNIYKDDLLKKYPLFPAPGNHDYHDNDLTADYAQIHHQTAYYQNFSMPENGEAGGLPSHSASFYSYDIGNIHFLSLDSYGMEMGKYRLYDTTGPQVEWVKKDLAANKNKGWVIAYWHHPPYSMGSHNSDTESELVHIRENFIRILERLGVDLVICGHSHNYERSRLMNGYYGKNAAFEEATYDLSRSSGWYDGTPNSCPYLKDDAMAKGTVYVVTGSAGQKGGVQAAYPHKALPYSNTLTAGAAILEVQANRLDFKWIDEDGKIGDHFTMMKKVRKDLIINAKKGQQITLTASYEGTYRWMHSDNREKSIQVMPPPGTTVYEVHDPFECIKERFEVRVSE